MTNILTGALRMYIHYFEPEAKAVLDQLKAEEGFSLLSDEAKRQMAETILFRIRIVTTSYFQYLVAEHLKEENPLAGFDFKLITNEEKERITPVILAELERGEISLPPRMLETIQTIRSNFFLFMKEMLSDLLHFRKEICDTLFDGRQYEKITGIKASGDTHNHGKSTSIIETDVGKLVFKPHSCQIDVRAYDFMNRYFRDIIVMPKVFAYQDEFGAVEFLEKKISEGREATKKYYRALGGTAAVLKMLGSTDMHCENLFACEGKLALIDIETLLYPVAAPEKNAFHILYGKKNAEELNHSVMNTHLLNGRVEMPQLKKDFSILNNLDEDGSAPVIDGTRRSVLEFQEDFFSGFSEWYDRCLELRSQIRADVKAEFSGSVMRSIVWATRSYGDILRRLNSCYSYQSADYYASQLEKLPGILKREKIRVFPQVEDKEIRALMEHEIPFFYTYGDSKDLYSEGELIASDYYDESAAERALSIIDEMNEAEKQFELQYMKLSLGLIKIKAEEIPPIIQPADIPLEPESAILEAEQIMEQIYEDSIRFTSGDLTWLLFDPGRENPDIMNFGLYTGISGMAVFFAAMAKASGDENIRAKARECLDSCKRLLLQFLKSEELPDILQDSSRFSLGEGSGIGGLLHALVILNHTFPGICEEHIRLAKQRLSLVDVAAFHDTDKAGGIAGLLVSLCRFEEYYSDPKMRELIRALADQLVSLKTMKAGDVLVWKTLADKNHPISGAVHGMTGIAEALYLADLRLGTRDFEAAAQDAIAFEDQSYDEKENDWMDLRVPGSHKPAKGNCYGTEGIGIICGRLMKEKMEAMELPRMYKRARLSVRQRPPLPLDHLCCGNMSTVDYYLETGDRDSAGRLLAAVVKQKDELGRYRLGYTDHLTNNNVTLFYGLAGIGYELLRYTDPGQFLTAL